MKQFEYCREFDNLYNNLNPDTYNKNNSNAF